MRSMTTIAFALLMACAGSESTSPADDQQTTTPTAGALSRRPFPADN